MAGISFSENHEAELISFENGKALAAVSDPYGEALRWVYSLGPIPTKEVVIIGLGSGFHVAALSEIDPDLKITVVDSRSSLTSIFRAQFKDLADRVEIVTVTDCEDLFKSDFYRDLLQSKPYVLSFRECWGEQVEFFAEIFAHLTGRSSDSVRYHLEDLGINMKGVYFDSSKLTSIKDILGTVDTVQASEKHKQLFMTLGELIK